MSDADPRLSRRDAERLLDAPADHDSALGLALTAASAPGFADELRREDATVAAFHAARVTPVPAGARTPSGRRAASRAVVATGAVVALATGGFALADVADLPLLPGTSEDRVSESTDSTPGRSVTSSDATATSGSPSTAGSSGDEGSSGSEGPRSPSSTSQSPTSSSPTSSAASPTPSYEGLCKAFQAADRSGAGKSLDSAAFQALATEAGGAGNIATYCIALIGPPEETGRPSDKPSPTKPPRPSPTRPTPTTKPTDKPSPDKPSPDKPSPGRPTDRPDSSNQPTDEPADEPSPGKPTDKPDSPGKPDEPGKGGNN